MRRVRLKIDRGLCLAALVCANLVLLTALLLCSYSLPKAYAQGAGLASNYLVVCGEVQDQFDALYMIDMRGRNLHAFYFDRASKQLEYADGRDLERDFRNNKD